ncbi:MAG: DUF86 domain-containing protein [Planctomycetes bacterium]|nr:DUF86 domain-containing protein [Planctomycetota bacterium]
MPRDDATLLDIAHSVRMLLDFTHGIDYSSFQSDYKTQSAVLHRLLLLGEAVKRLSPELQAAHPDIPWKPMAGMRDKLIHAYDEVDLQQVWRTVERDIPRLLTQLGPLLPPSDE